MQNFQVSLLLGTIVRKVPLQSSPSSESLHLEATSCASGVSVMMVSDAMLDLKQLETIGNHFLEVLLKMKHNGAIDKTRAGFTALCNRLLCSNDPRYVSVSFEIFTTRYILILYSILYLMSSTQ